MGRRRSEFEIEFVAMDYFCWKRRLHYYAAICFFCLCIYPIYSAHTNTSSIFPSETKFQSTIQADYYKHLEQNKIWEIMRGRSRRLLGGPGSSPPRCASKCGGCMPCKPVHVAVPPGTRVTTEYYPEAWRCKCGNKLYMP